MGWKFFDSLLRESLILFFFFELIYSLLLTSIIKEKKKNLNEEVTFRVEKGMVILFSSSNLK